jgi:hypothetical protein
VIFVQSMGSWVKRFEENKLKVLKFSSLQENEILHLGRPYNCARHS